MRTRVSDFDEASDNEQRTQAMGMCPLSGYVFFFFFSYHFSVHCFIYIACCSCHVVMNMPEESNATVGPAVPTIPIPTVPTTPIPAGPSNFLTLVPSSIKNFVIVPTFFLHFLAKGLCYALNFLSSPSPVEGALSTRFEIGSNSATVPDPVG